MAEPTLTICDEDLLKALEEAMGDTDAEMPVSKPPSSSPIPSKSEPTGTTFVTKPTLPVSAEQSKSSTAIQPSATTGSVKARLGPKPAVGTVRTVPTDWTPFKKPDPPVHLPVKQFELCWNCGYPGHTRQRCGGVPRLFCSQCGLYGTMTRDCSCYKARQLRKRHAVSRPKSPPRKVSRGVQCDLSPPARLLAKASIRPQRAASI